MKKFVNERVHRPDCGCAECITRKSLRSHPSIPKARTASRMVLGLGQEEDDYESEEDTYEDTYAEDDAVEEESDEVAESEEDDSPEEEVAESEDDSGFDWSSLLSVGLSTTAQAAQIAKATGILPGGKKITTQLAPNVVAPSGAPLTARISSLTTRAGLAKVAQTPTVWIAAGALAVGAYLYLRKK